MTGFVPEPLDQRHVIVAEDDPSTLALLKKQLELARYQVTACPDGSVALNAIRQQGEGLIVADWGMPEMNGVELCRAVRELQAENVLRSVHIILLTANSEKQHIVAGLEAGADDYLTKPYHKQELLARIRAGIRSLELLKELYRQKLEVQKANNALQVLNDKLERLASIDELSGLLNRRMLFERLTEFWSRAERRDTTLGAIMVDIDHFKHTNDTYGHQAGDVVIAHVADLMRASTRPYDICGRFGGEEFIVVCPDSDTEALYSIAERLRTRIADSSPKADGQTIRVTVSVGVAARSARHATVEDLIQDADAMLYKAKQNGRNQAWFCDAEGAARLISPTPQPAP